MKRFLGVLLVLILVSGGLTGCASAEFEVSQLTITPSQVATGEDFTVSAEIINVGDADGIYTATLTVNNIERATRDITVAAGMTETVSFVLTEESSGSYNIALNDMTVLLSILSADEIVEGVTQSLYEIDTYQYDMSVTIDMVGVVDDEEGELTFNIDSNGTVDNVNRRMWIETELAMLMVLPEEGEMVVGMEIYLIGNDAYTLIEVEDETPLWLKERMPIGGWDEITKLDTDVAILEEAEVAVVGSEKIRGIDCYVLEIIPSEERLLDATTQGASIAEEQFLAIFIEEYIEELIGELIEDASVKQWIEKDTSFLAKTEITMSGEVSPSVIGDEGEGMLTINMTVTSLIFNYNESVNIELPTGAEEAILWDTNEFLEEGETEAAETEFANVQTAVIAMMVDNELAYLPNPVILPTNDMSTFPDTSVCGIDKIQDTNGNLYVRGEDMNGYFLYQHDIIGDGARIGLVNYLASQHSMGTYIVDSMGTVTQVTTGFE